MSIKKAQHAAAALALSKTNYKQPQTKLKLKASGHYSNTNYPTNKHFNQITNVFYFAFIDNITPTVELNALAMKRGEQTIYTVIETPQYITQPPPNTVYNSYRTDLYSHTRNFIATGPYSSFNNIV